MDILAAKVVFTLSFANWEGGLRRDKDYRRHGEDLFIIPSINHKRSLIIETKTTFKIDVLDPILTVFDDPYRIVRPTKDN